jgi:small conductance mechanosensitive channel
MVEIAALSPTWRIALAIGVGLLAFPIAGWLALAVRRVARRARDVEGIDATLTGFLAEIVRIGILIGALVLVLTLAGVEPTSVATVLGAATLAIGLALQSTLSNVAAGVLIILFHIYRVGDLVEVTGRRGIVRMVSLFFTEIVTPQNHKITIPNNQVLAGPVWNLSAMDKRRVDIDVTLAWDTDTEAAAKLAKGCVGRDARVLKDPEGPVARVMRLTDKGPVLSLQVWALASEAPQLGLDLPGKLHAALREGGVKSAEADGRLA